ncbi:MAG: YihY/virulence factor BrkB family protein [Acidobacteriota bacterium]
MRTKTHRRRIVMRTFMSFMDNDLTTAAAAVSYFSMLALFPTLLVVLAIGNRLIGPETVEKYVIGQVLALLPGARTFVSKNLESISTISTGIIVSCLFVMLWAASWMFTVIEKALNRVWGTYPRSFLHGRAVNIAVMTLVWGLLASSALFTAFVTAVRSAANRIPLRVAPWLTALSGYAWQIVFVVASLAVTVLLFAVLYKLLPNTRVSIMEALPGAVLAGVFWEAAKFGFAFLLPYFHYDLLYGSIGAGVALLTWVYLSSVIMLFGAQFTALLHRDHLFNASENLHQPSAEMPAIKASRA